MNTFQTSEFTGLNYAEVMTEVTKYVRPTLQAAKEGNQELTEQQYDVMIAKLKEAKELVVEEKTYQWQFKDFNNHYENWELCLNYINQWLDMNFQGKLVTLLNKAKQAA